MEDGATRLATPNKAGTPAGKRSPLEAFASSFRNKQFHTSFDELPHNEEVNQNFICSLRGEGLAKQKGRLYLTQNYAAFTSSLFGKTTKHVARWEDITGIEADIGEITITTPDKELTFSTFVNFDEALEAINESWRSSLAGPSTNGITYTYQKGLKRKESNNSTTSDSDDDYMTSTDDEADGEVTYEDLMKSVSSAKESIGHEMNEEKDREKEAEDTVSEGKKTGRHDDEDDDDSSSSSSEEDEEGERVLEELKKKALEEKKALLQTLKKQKEDELLQKRLELAQKLQEKKVKHTTYEEDTKEDQDQKPEIKINDKVWEEVEQTAEKLTTQEGEGEREDGTEKKGTTTTKEDREKEPEKEPDTPAKTEEPKQSPVVQKQDKPSTTVSQPSKTTTTLPTTTPTSPSPAITTTTVPQKVDLMKKPQEVAGSGTTLWLLGAAVVVAIGVLAMYKMRAK